MVCLVVIRMMDAQGVGEFVFRDATQLAHVQVTGADFGLERFRESRRVTSRRLTTEPSRIFGTRYRRRNHLAPFGISRQCKSTLARSVSARLVLPVFTHCSRVLWPFATPLAALRFAGKPSGHGGSVSLSPNVGHAAVFAQCGADALWLTALRAWFFLAWHGGILA
jgi:hypothetical protein